MQRNARAERLAATVTPVAIVGLAILLHALLARPWGGLVAASCRWDCVWYDRIAAHGYAALPQLYDPVRLGQADWAFFPLFPLLAGLLARVTHLPVPMAALTLNIALLPCLIALCADDLKLQGRAVGAWFLAAFFVLYPFNVWYVSQYSETVFGVALIGGVVALRRGRVWLAAVAFFLLGMARPTGFVLAACIAGYDIVTGRIGGDRTASTPARRLADGVLLVAAAGAGLGVFVVYLDHLTGDGFAFMHVQIAWHRRFRFFILPILHALGHRHWLPQGLFAIAGIVLIVWLIRTGRLFAGLVVGVTALLAGSTGAASIERFVFSNPLVIEVGASLAWQLGPRRRWAVLAAMAVGQVLATELWFSGSDILT
jgi:Mannosyltransferase (PIG-V)